MPNWAFQDLINQAKFKDLVIARFPETKMFLEDKENDGLLHLEMSAFRRYSQQFIDNGDFRILQEIFDLIESILDKVHPEVENAIYVSFLENFDFEGTENDKKAKYLLPPKLKRMLKELEK